MKKLLYIILLLVTTHAWSNSALLEKGNQLYAEEKYAEAIEAYEQIINADFESYKVYFNLGNAYYKTGQLAKSILFYERAKLLKPNDEDIQYNLDLANQHVTDNIITLPQVFFVRWWQGLINRKSVDQWSWISIVAFVLFIGLFAVFMLTRSLAWKKRAFWFGTLMLIISIMTVSFAWKQKRKLTQRNYAIIFAPSVTVKSSPAESGTKLFVIHEGLKVEITDSVGEWKEIRLADGNKGWLQDNTVVRI